MSIDGKDGCICISIYMCVNIHRYAYVCVYVLRQFSEFRDRSDTFTLVVCNGCQLMVRMIVSTYIYIYIYIFLYICLYR
jgi:hypothetical protein